MKRRLNPAPLAQCGTGGTCGVELLFRIAPHCAASDCTASHTGDAADGSRGVVPRGREGGREGVREREREGGREGERGQSRGAHGGVASAFLVGRYVIE